MAPVANPAPCARVCVGGGGVGLTTHVWSHHRLHHEQTLLNQNSDGCAMSPALVGAVVLVALLAVAWIVRVPDYHATRQAKQYHAALQQQHQGGRRAAA